MLVVFGFAPAPTCDAVAFDLEQVGYLAQALRRQQSNSPARLSNSYSLRLRALFTSSRICPKGGSPLVMVSPPLVKARRRLDWPAWFDMGMMRVLADYSRIDMLVGDVLQDCTGMQPRFGQRPTTRQRPAALGGTRFNISSSAR